ncbi:MAG: MFS transporter [Pseudomonadota bacterium]
MAGISGGTNPIAVIDANPMSVRQWVVVVLMMFLNALDGFDVLSSALASAGFSKDWGMNSSALGWVLGADLIGMGFGSIFLGSLADKIGRKPTMLICLLIMAIGMYAAAALATGPQPMFFIRLVTGIGIGGMLAATNAVTAETTSSASRSLAMALYVIGYPLGGTIGGFAAQLWLLKVHDWHAVFMFGAVCTAVMIPLVALLVPETPAFHAARQKPDALARINRSLRALMQPAIDALPQIKAGLQPKVSDILSKPGLRKVTWLLALGYMVHTFTFYYVLKFAVKIVSDAGYTQPEAASTLTWANIGGAIGGFLFGFLLKKWDIKGPAIACMVLGAGAVAYFGMGHDTLNYWRLSTFLQMFFLNAAIVGFYAAFARGFPAYARATGTGFALGIGRAGAAGSPIVAGYLFTAFGGTGTEKGHLIAHLMPVSLVMTIGSLVGVVLLLMLPLRDADRDLFETPQSKVA